jgi:hypothetical protein
MFFIIMSRVQNIFIKKAARKGSKELRQQVIKDGERQLTDSDRLFPDHNHSQKHIVHAV